MGRKGVVGGGVVAMVRGARRESGHVVAQRWNWGERDGSAAREGRLAREETKSSAAPTRSAIKQNRNLCAPVVAWSKGGQRARRVSLKRREIRVHGVRRFPSRIFSLQHAVWKKQR